MMTWMRALIVSAGVSSCSTVIAMSCPEVRVRVLDLLQQDLGASRWVRRWWWLKCNGSLVSGRTRATAAQGWMLTFALMAWEYFRQNLGTTYEEPTATVVANVLLARATSLSALDLTKLVWEGLGWRVPGDD